MADLATYTGREQTLIKHFILREYLGRFAHIIGSRWDAITYVDCFAGPWSVRSEQLEDSSFHIAIAQLRKARGEYRKQGREIRMRCFFIERDPEAFARLKDFADRIDDVGSSAFKAKVEGLASLKFPVFPASGLERRNEKSGG